VRRGGRLAIYDVGRGVASPDAKRPRPDFVRRAGHAGARRPRLVTGPVFNALVTRGRLPGVAFRRELRLYHGGPRIDVVLQLDKQVQTEYESLYLAFPLAGARPTMHVENARAVYRAGAEQLPGSATDWHSVGDFVAVEAGGRTTIVAPLDTPLVQLGDIHTAKWQPRLALERAHVYAWVMNNMWFTNFPAFQEGAVTLTWSLTAHAGGFDREAAATFARCARVGAGVSYGGQA
jgi:hypothetical protein